MARSNILDKRGKWMAGRPLYQGKRQVMALF
jgi:hypothetical protein